MMWIDSLKSRKETSKLNTFVVSTQAEDEDEYVKKYEAQNVKAQND